MAKKRQNKRGSNWFFVYVSFGIFILDQITKKIFSQTGSIPIIDGYLHLSLTKNTGISFGLLQNTRLLPLLIALIIIVGLLWYYPQIPKGKSYQFFTALVLGGALGNVLDRLLYGYVIDFIDFMWWPAFNIADAGITIGALGLIILLWQEK